jgi:hypothetical protein
MKAFLGLVALAFATLAPSAASAKDAGNGYVTGFLIFPTGGFYFFTNGTITGTTPGCDTGGLPQRWGFDGSTAAGQTMASVILTAYSTHQLIRVVTSGTCVSGYNSEMPGFIITNNVQ